MRRLFLRGVVFSTVMFLPCALHAQEEFYHPELEWNTIETGHFLIHYHEGAERTGRAVAKIAEEIYEPVTSLYNHVPDRKVSFIIKDYDDISNGAAYFYDNKIEIYAPSMDFDLRGTHNWLRNVVTHEFTHIVQIQTSMKFGRTLPAFYLQWLGYESERRTDVLYGFPNIVASYPLSGFVVPVWFAEGVAQYNREELRYDFWDSHRDMILRSYVLDGKMLTWEQMGVFGKTSLGNESSYNAGFAFVHYIAQRYGEEKLVEISRNLSTLIETTIDGAIERAVGKSGRDVYNEWRDELARSYAARVAPVRTNIREGVPVVFTDEDEPSSLNGRYPEKKAATRFRDALRQQPESMPGCCARVVETGFANLYAKYSPDGKKFAFVSTMGGDYFGSSGLYVADLKTRRAKEIRSGVGGDMSWAPDGNKLYYSRISRSNPFWSLVHDIYVYDLKEEKETRLTHGRRATSPAVSPDGSTIAFVVNNDGTSNVATMKIDGSDFKLVTSYASGEQAYNPEWGPAGDRIVFDYSIKDGRDIAWVRPDATDLQILVSGADDSRSAVFIHDGSRLVFSSDRTGIFNLYTYTIGTGAIEQLTNVLGGAFLPTVNAQGDVIYSAYTSGGYKFYSMEAPSVLAKGDYHYADISGASVVAGSGSLAMRTVEAVGPQYDWSSLRSYDDTKLPPFDSRSYRSIFTSLTIVPFLRVDNYNPKNKALDVIKPGVYLFSNDILEHTGFFAGAALNRKLERDLFLQFNYRGKIPLFYHLGLDPVASIELYNVTRKTDNVISLPASTIPVDLTYNLLEFDFVLNQRIFSSSTHVEFRFMHSRYTSIIENFINPETNPPSLVPGSSDLYLIANDLSLTLTHEAIARSSTMEINPVGRKIWLRIGRELNKFNGDGEYEVTSTGLQPVYKRINFTRVEMRWREHIPFFFKNHTLTATVRGGSILERTVDDFFDFYAGGLIGMKGYPFYSIGGNELAVAGLAYRFPLIDNIDIRILQFYFDKLYMSVYGDIGNAWSGKTPILRKFKTDAGVELRLESFSWYAYPTRIFFNASYGFDEFQRIVRGSPVTYGKEWRFYFGVLFGFEFD
ncbi:MAG: PD40 domain-containing protein [Ignavibacteriae bacterium]|nr:PD40 domain-containing protein [Ignavibacteriota bacterium]